MGTLGALALSLVVLTQTTLGQSSRFRRLDPPAPRLTFRSDKDLVLINATVYDRNGRIVTDLSPQNFRLFEEKRPVDIRQFTLEETPLSTVILLDLSGSMTGGIGYIRDALARYISRANPGDEFCLVSFAGSIQSDCTFTTDAGEILRQASTEPPKGKTALFDAMVFAFNSVKKAVNTRKAILVLSDAIDTGSRYSFRETEELARETMATVYIVRPGPGIDEDRGTLIRLAEMVELTGGRMFEIDRLRNVPDFLDHLDIRQQYMIGFDPPASANDGKYHRVTLKLDAGDNRRLRVYWKHGYYAPSQSD